MKILHAIHNFPPEFQGGTERYLDLLVGCQREAGDEPVVVTGSGRRGAEAAIDGEDRHGTRVHRFRAREGTRNTVDPHDPDADRLIGAILEREAPSVLHVHHWHQLTSRLVVLAAERRIPSVVTLNDLYASCALFFRAPGPGAPCDADQGSAACVPCILRAYDLRDPQYGIEVGHSVAMRALSFEKELFLARRVIVPSRAHGEVIARFVALDPARVRVVPLGTPRQAAAPPRVRAGALSIVHFGHLSELKGTHLLLDAVARSGRSDRIVVHLHGEALDPGTRDALSPARLPSFVRLHGTYDAADLGRVVGEADVAVFPSLARESYSFVLDEALRAGIPVLVSDRGALPERIGSRGLAFAAGDPEALASILRRLVDDPRALASLRAGSPGPILTPEENAALVRAVYEEAILEGPPALAPGADGLVLERLAHRNRRFTEIERHVRHLLGGRETTPP